MVRLFRVAVACIISAIVVPHAYCQNKVSPSLSQIYNNYVRFSYQNPQERVYLHFDNTGYYKGEHIWYKANVVRGDNFQATPLSRILYVELVSPIGFPVETQKLVIENGQAHGGFLLSETLNAGFYEVRAYTSWMLNFTPGNHHGWRKFTGTEYRKWLGSGFQNYLKGNAGIYSRVFPVYDAVRNGKYGVRTMLQPSKTTSDIVDVSKDKLTIQFYPEGGNYVEGVPSRIAFEAKNAYGKDVRVSGDIMCGNARVGSFCSIYGGRGLFTVIPDSSGESLAGGLHLKTSYEGRDYDFSLPRALRKGVALSAIQRQDRIVITVQRNAATVGDTLGLLVSCRGNVEFLDTVNIRDHLMYTEVIDRKDLQTGVNIVTLYRQDGTVAAQRELFINNHDMKGYVIAGGQSDENRLTPCQRICLHFQLRDSTGNPVKRKETFSLSVTDGKYHDEGYDDGNIMTDLLLSSELKGFIPYPSYYFERDDAAHRQALDLLMMVQGWTRYDFCQMTAKAAFRPQFGVERNITFSGRVWNSRYHTDRIPVLLRGIRKEVDSKQGYGNAEEWDSLKHEVWLDTEMPRGDSTLRGELQTHDKGRFDYYIPDFYGKRCAYIMMNRKDTRHLGALKAGISGHLLQPDARTDSSLEGKYVISPAIAYPPLAKPYGYYETDMPDADTDREFVNALTLTGISGNDGAARYDKINGSFILRTVVKKSRRKWHKVKEEMPVLDVDIQDLMSYLSCISGRIQNFNLGVFSSLNVSSPIRYLFPEIMGLSGHVRMSVNGYPLSSLGSISGSHYVYGRQKYVPKGNEALPLTDDFSRLRLYADVRNRDLLYTPGRYHESVEYSVASDQRFPITIHMAFTTDSTRRGRINTQFFTGNRIVIQGFSRPDDFYSPDYSRMPLPIEKDYRRTLYWNPDVTTDSNGNATVEFYNNSSCRQMIISAEGITKEGMPVMYKNQ